MTETRKQEVRPLGLAQAIVDLRRDDALRETNRRLEEGDDPMRIVSDCRDGMTTVGDRFAEGEFYLAELVLAGEIFTAVFALLEPRIANLSAAPAQARSTVVMATPKGDIHDLGKGIVVMMLRAYGFEVHDLGVDVEPVQIVNKVRETHASFLGLSALLTTAVERMKEVIDLLHAEDLRDSCKVMIGGGVTSSFLKQYVGADFQTTDVMAGVDYCINAGNSQTI